MNISIFGLRIEEDEHVANNRFASREFGDSNNITYIRTKLFFLKKFSIFRHYELDWENAFSRRERKIKAPYEIESTTSITTSIACNEMYGLTKKTTEIIALCHTLSCANAPSCKIAKATNTSRI